MTAMIMPNVIIAGAPKCGTTSLFDWLSDHPEVCASTVKELSYFMDSDYPELGKINVHNAGMDRYSSYFEHCRGRNAKVILEATPHYVYQKTALSMLSALSPRPKIIFILRKPSARVYSLFGYSKNNLSIVDQSMEFSDYLDAVKRRDEGPLRGRVFLLNAIEHSRYVNYLQDWVNAFGRVLVHVFLFEHMRENPAEFMRRVSACIGIDGAFWDGYSFAKTNATYQVRSHTLRKLKIHIAHLLPEGILQNLKYAADRISPKAVKKKTFGMAERDAEILDELEQNEFARDNKRLADMLNIDLAAWK